LNLKHFVVASSVIAAALAVNHNSASAAQIVGVDVGDAYCAPHGANGTGINVPLFVDPTHFFNYYYSTMPVKWTLQLPPELQGKPLKVTAATITIWASKASSGWDPTKKFQVFNSGVSGNHGFTRDNWTESNIWYTPGSAEEQDPFLLDLSGNHAEDNEHATPFAEGVVDPSYTGGTMTDAVKVTFSLDVNTSTIQQRLLDDLAAGYSMFAIAGNFPTTQGGGDPYPRVVTKEGVSDASNGTSQKAPALVIEVQDNSSVADWNVY